MSRLSFSQQMSEGSSGMRDPRRPVRRLVPLTPPVPIADIRLADLFDREQTRSWFNARRGTIGNAAGVDGIQLRHLQDSDIPRLCNTIIQAITRGDFTPSPLRQVDFLRPDGRIRTLRLQPVIERIVCGAAADYLARAVAAQVGPNVHGSIPNRGVQTLLAGVTRFIESSPPDRPLFICEMDVVRAFDNVRLRSVTEVLVQLGFQQDVVAMIERMVTPAGQTGEIIGLPQGNPLSPILFALTMDSCIKLANNQGDRAELLTPLIYVDNCVYMTHQERLLIETIQRHRTALNQTGLDYGSTQPGAAATRDGGTATILGNELSIVENSPAYRIPADRVNRTREAIIGLSLSTTPAEDTWTAINAYVASKGQVFATVGRDYCSTILSAILEGSELTDEDRDNVLRNWEFAGNRWRGRDDQGRQDPNASIPEEMWELDPTDENPPPWSILLDDQS